MPADEQLRFYREHKKARFTGTGSSVVALENLHLEIAKKEARLQELELDEDDIELLRMRKRCRLAQEIWESGLINSAARGQLTSEGVGTMEIDNDPEVVQINKASKRHTATIRLVHSVLRVMKEYDTSDAPPNIACMLDDWQHRTVAQALGFGTG